MAMNVYNKVLIELSKTQSFKTCRNNLVKLQYSTEDDALRTLIDNWCRVLSQAEIMSKCKQSMRLRQLLTDNKHIKDELKNYCTACIQSQQPEWQILALRNGWRPMS